MIIIIPRSLSRRSSSFFSSRFCCARTLLARPISAMMTQSYPASTTRPRYLTGDQAGLREFLDKFDVGILSHGRGVLENTAIADTDMGRSFCSTAMVCAVLLSLLRFPDAGKGMVQWLSRYGILGVLWSGDYVFPGTVETLELLRKKGLHDE